MRQYIRSVYRLLWPLLYRRSEFKLFLKAALGDIDLNLQRLAALSDSFSGSVKPIPLEAPFGKSMLVVAPHQDDEAIGCGGVVALQARGGRPVQVVLVQDGADGCEDQGMTREQLRDLRNEESRRSAAIVGAQMHFLNHPRLLPDAPGIVAQLAALLIQHKVDVVLTPYLLDGHLDHRHTNLLLAEALKQVSWPVRVLGYEVWGLCIPNVIVNIDAVIETKLEMLRCFTFANQALDYTNTTKGLNMYRSRLYSTGRCSYAECFFEVPREEFIALVDRIKAIER
jgi:LmbE family N-acetylglucosaminyl deacetylase